MHLSYDKSSTNQEENVKGSPRTSITLTTPATDYMELKEPRAAQREVIGSL